MSSRRIKGSSGMGSSALTPLLDTLFLLLFTLLATSRSATIVEAAVREEVAVELPEVMDDGQGATSADELTIFTVAVDVGGAVRLLSSRDPQARASEMASPEALRNALVAAAEVSSVRVEIRADGEASHRAVLEVLQAVRTARISDVRFVALEASDPAPSNGVQR